MKNPLVSVIVPVYCSESYLPVCCQSLFSQTLASIEYLFIIDGPSSEAESIILQQLVHFPERKKQVRIISHNSNYGISFCRQEGHDLATGRYLFHCDSDDWVETDTFSLLVDEAEKTQSDLVYFDYCRHYEPSQKILNFSSESVMQGHIQTLDAPLHNKLINRQFVIHHHLRFPVDINWGEDLCMSFLCQIFSTRIAYLPKTLYHLRMYSSSYTGCADREKYLQLIKCPQFLEAELQKTALSSSYSLQLLQMKFEVKEYLLIEPSLRDIAYWRTLYPECHSIIWKSGVYFPLYLRVIAWLAANQLIIAAEILLRLRDHISHYRYAKTS